MKFNTYMNIIFISNQDKCFTHGHIRWEDNCVTNYYLILFVHLMVLSKFEMQMMGEGLFHIQTQLQPVLWTSIVKTPVETRWLSGGVDRRSWVWIPAEPPLWFSHWSGSNQRFVAALWHPRLTSVETRMINIPKRIWSLTVQWISALYKYSWLLSLSAMGMDHHLGPPLSLSRSPKKSIWGFTEQCSCPHMNYVLDQ